MKRRIQNFLILATTILLLNGVMFTSCRKADVSETLKTGKQTEILGNARNGNLQAKAMLYLELLKKLAQNESFVFVVKNYYESREKDETFDYIVPLSVLLSEYDRSVGGAENLLRKYFSVTQTQEILSGLAGMEFQGKIYVPELNIFYYEEQFKSFARWDGKFIDEILYNSASNKELTGYKTDGTTETYLATDPQAEGKILAKARWIFQWNGEGETERPIASCHCYDFTDGLERPDCAMGGYGRWCGLSVFGSGCVGICRKTEPSL